MRNLKRALSLTLASVMLLGMMVVGSSAAAGYSDVDDNDNVEAIEVLQAIEVMVGDAGSTDFRPDEPVRRAEMAVVMGKLLNLNYNYYSSTCPFSDVSGDYDWAKGWVGAAYANKILSGRSADVFAPGDYVTAVEAASMMMRALGYFKYAEDIADGFQLATVRQGNQIGIFNGVGTDANTPLTRNQVAQMALNALRSEIVDFTGTPGIEVNGVKVGYRAQYDPRTGTEAKYNAIAGLTTTLGKDESRYYVQLGEELYDGDLRLINTAADDFDRPSRHWEYDGREIGTYAKDELIRKEYTEAVTGKDLYDLLSGATIKEYDVTYYVDGELDEATIKPSNMIRTNTKKYSTTGNGVLTQVFVDNSEKEITIVSIHTYLAQATADYNAKKGTLSLKVFKDNATGEPKTVDVEVVPGIENYKKDDYVLVNWAEIGSGNSGNYPKFEVVKVYDPEVLEDQKLNKYSHESYVVKDGTQYDYGKDGVQKNELGNYYSDGTGGSYLRDFTYSLYFDQYGYLAGVIKYSGEARYLFLTGYDRPESNLSIQTADAAAIFLDGTMQTIKVNVSETNKKLDTDADGTEDQSDYEFLKDPGAPQYNKWFKYTTKGEGDNAVYTLTPIAAGSWLNVAATSFANRGINTASVRLTGTTPNTGKAWGNEESAFITVEAKNNAVDGNGTTTAAITKVKDVYTGMDDTDLEVQSTAVVATHFVDSVFAVMDDENYIIGAIVVGDAKNSNKNWAYAIKEAKAEWIDGDYTYWEFEAVVDGEIKDLTVKDKYGDTISDIQAVVGATNIDDSGLMRLTYDKDGNVVDAVTYASKSTTAESAEATKNKVYENGDLDAPVDVDPDTFGAYNIQWNTGDLTGNGRTLYGKAADPGLVLAKGAPVIVIQREKDSEGNYSIVYDTFADYLAARSELVDEDAYKGWVSAVIGNKGAQYVVIKEETAKDVTTDDPSIGSGKALEVGIDSNDADKGKVINATLAALGDGAYQIEFADNGKDAAAPNASAQKNIRYIPFTASKDDVGKVTLTIMKKGGGLVYGEDATINDAKVGPNYFFIDVGDSTGATNPGGYGSMAGASKAGTALTKGTYTFTVKGGTGVLAKGEFEIG